MAIDRRKSAAARFEDDRKKKAAAAAKKAEQEKKAAAKKSQKQNKDVLRTGRGLKRRKRARTNPPERRLKLHRIGCTRQIGKTRRA